MDLSLPMGDQPYRGQDLGAPVISWNAADKQLCIANSRPLRIVAAIFIAVGAGLIAAPWFWSEDDVAHRLGCRVMGILLLLIGLATITWVNELRLDVSARTYLWRRGFGPFSRARRGGFDDMECVLLEFEAGDVDTYSKWPVFLVWKQSPNLKRKISTRPWGITDGADPPRLLAEKDAQWYGNLLGLSVRSNISE